MENIKCKTCDSGTLVRRKKYRMSSVVVVIGYIILIPSVLGILIGGIGLVTAGAAGKSTMQNSRAKVEAELRAANVPAPVITRVTAVQDLAASDTARLTARQRGAVRNAHLTLTASAAGTGIGVGVAAGFSIFVAVASLVGGLLGWLLIMKKRVLQCNNCGAVVAAG